jgi:hypothetical protein
MNNTNEEGIHEKKSSFVPADVSSWIKLRIN